MDATSAQLESLDRLQDLDRKRLQAQHALEHLPQRGQILALRKKRAGIEESWRRFRSSTTMPMRRWAS